MKTLQVIHEKKRRGGGGKGFYPNAAVQTGMCAINLTTMLKIIPKEVMSS